MTQPLRAVFMVVKHTLCRHLHLVQMCMWVCCAQMIINFELNGWGDCNSMCRYFNNRCKMLDELRIDMNWVERLAIANIPLGKSSSNSRFPLDRLSERMMKGRERRWKKPENKNFKWTQSMNCPRSDLVWLINECAKRMMRCMNEKKKKKWMDRSNKQRMPIEANHFARCNIETI